MKLITEDFKVIPATTELAIPAGTAPKDAAMAVARHKAIEVVRSNRGEMVIGADTLVVLDGISLGKPTDKWDAANMLLKLQGRVHTVYTGVWIIYEDYRELGFADATEVEFYPLTRDMILQYVETGEPMDKAGAYGIQDHGALFVKRIIGDYYNVMGLPVAHLNHILVTGG